MAPNLAVILTFTALSFLFSFSSALSPLDQAETNFQPGSDNSLDLLESNFQIGDGNSVDLPGSDFQAGAAILLPSEKPNIEAAATVVETHPGESNSKLTEPETVNPESVEEKTEAQIDSVPLTFVTFRPINRRFGGFHLFPFRRGHKCHGRHRHHFNYLNEFRPRLGQRFDHQARVVSYGNDMIVAKDQDQHGFDPASYGGSRGMEMWKRYNHRRGQFVNDEKVEGMDEMRQHSRHHHHHHHHHHDGDEREENGFMKGIRKFLGHF